MRVQRTRTKQLRAPLTTTLRYRKVRSAISTRVRLIVDWIIIISAKMPRIASVGNL